MADEVTFSSHPTEKFRMAGFQFVKGVLTLSAEEAERFRSIMAKQPVYIQNTVKEISLDAADEIARRFKAGRMVQGIDTTANSIEAPAAFDGQHTDEAAGTEKSEDPPTPKPRFSFGNNAGDKTVTEPVREGDAE